MKKRAEIRVALEGFPLPIPYGESKREDGENFGYRSILKDPKAIDEIPELDGESGMKEFFRRFHDASGIFESVRMFHCFNSSGGRFERCFCFGFVFRDRTLFSEYHNCFLFVGRLLAHISNGTILCDAPFLVEIQPAMFLDEKVVGWMMDLYVSGFGDSEDAARQRLDLVLKGLMPLFQNEGAPS
jgi:hypothetical protein